MYTIKMALIKGGILLLYQRYIAYLDTPIGILEISTDEHRVVEIEFVQAKYNPERRSAILQHAISQLTEYFRGSRKKFNLPIALSGTAFQQKVWQELMNIPYGETLSYGEVARKINNPKASRAVGNANNRNKIPIVIPCHRVIGSNGNLVGYGGELWRKKWLLDHEKMFKND